MTSSYYLWKWADNDLPGKPNQVFSTLLKGDLHPALRTFDARRLLKGLEVLAANGRQLGEDWTWQAQPAGDPTRAHFVFLQAPMLDATEERYIRFSGAMKGLDISGYDEQFGYVIQGMRPKLNCLIFGQYPRERAYDITAEELAPLLRRVDGALPDPFAVLEDRRHYFVQCLAHKRRFCVEWRESYDINNWEDFAHWRASIPAGVTGKKSPPGHADHDTLTFADTVRVFQAFLQGEPKPNRYRWRSIKSLLAREKARRQKVKKRR